MNSDDTIFEGENTIFFARVSREVSHELSNVMAVIGELSGLMGDLAAVGSPALDKLKAVAEKIERQTARGKETIGHFNRFAHSLDVPAAEFDLGELLHRFTVLAKRSVEHRRAELSLNLPGEAVTMTSNPFLLYRMLFDALYQCLVDGAELSVTLRTDGDTVEICFEGQEDVPVPDAAMDAVKTAARLNGTVRASEEGKAWIIRLSRRSLPLNEIAKE